MTKEEIKDLTIFIGKDVAFISKHNKNGKISSVRKQLTDNEINSFGAWYIQNTMDKLGASEFLVNINGEPKFKVSVYKEEEKNKEDNE